MLYQSFLNINIEDLVEIVQFQYFEAMIIIHFDLFDNTANNQVFVLPKQRTK